MSIWAEFRPNSPFILKCSLDLPTILTVNFFCNLLYLSVNYFLKRNNNLNVYVIAELGWHNIWYAIWYIKYIIRYNLINVVYKQFKVPTHVHFRFFVKCIFYIFKCIKRLHAHKLITNKTLTEIIQDLRNSLRCVFAAISRCWLL